MIVLKHDFEPKLQHKLLLKMLNKSTSRDLLQIEEKWRSWWPMPVQLNASWYMVCLGISLLNLSI